MSIQRLGYIYDLGLGYTSRRGLERAHLMVLMDTDIQGPTHITTDHELVNDPALRKFYFSLEPKFIKLNVGMNAISNEVAFSFEMDCKFECHFE